MPKCYRFLNRLGVLFGAICNLGHLEPNPLEKEICSRDFESAQEYKQLSDMSRESLLARILEKCEK